MNFLQKFQTIPKEYMMTIGFAEWADYSRYLLTKIRIPDALKIRSIFQPIVDIEDSNDSFRAALSKQKSTWVVIGLISMLINVLMLTGPIFMLQIYDRVLASGSVPTLSVIAILALLLYLFMGLFEAIRGRMLLRVGQSLDSQLTARAFSVSAGLQTPDNRGAQSRPLEDLDAVRQFFSGQGPAALLDIPWMPLYLAIVFMFHQMLGLVAVAGALIICVLAALNDVLNRKPLKDANAVSNQRRQAIAESRQNAETIGAMGMMNALCHQWVMRNDTFLDKQRDASDWSLLFLSSIKTVRFILQSAILAAGAWLAIHQEISAGVMIAASIMTARALAPVEQTVGQWRSISATYASLKRLDVALAGTDDPQDKTDLPLPKKSVRLDQVYCTAGDDVKPLIKGVSLDLKAGDGLGIIGPSGSGKSTLAKSIVGVLPLLRGSVRFDGAELKQWATGEIGRFVGYLPQEVQLFDGTIAQNIARFDPEATSKSVIEAAKLANIHDLIVGLADGYDTKIRANGQSLAAGQRQRIALARALYGNPFLVLLDEPHSNLDADGEKAVIEAARAMRSRGSVVLIIAHRPAVMSAVDQILCLKDGQVAGLGPRDEYARKTVRPLRKVGAA